MATNLTQIADEQRALEALKEEQDLRNALLSKPPKGTTPYALTRGMWDGREFVPRGSIVFFKAGEAPASAKKLKVDDDLGSTLAPEGQVRIGPDLDLPEPEGETLEELIPKTPAPAPAKK